MKDADFFFLQCNISSIIHTGREEIERESYSVSDRKRGRGFGESGEGGVLGVSGGIFKKQLCIAVCKGMSAVSEKRLPHTGHKFIQTHEFSNTPCVGLPKEIALQSFPLWCLNSITNT